MLAVEYGADAPLDLLVTQFGEAYGIYPEDVIDAPASLYWLGVWRELKQAQIDKQVRDNAPVSGTRP